MTTPPEHRPITASRQTLRVRNTRRVASYRRGVRPINPQRRGAHVNLFQKNRLVRLLALLAVIPLSACGGDSSGPGGQRNAPDSITVLADSSLKKAFTRMGNQFETQNPGSTVSFTYGASTALAQQASAGDPGDTL